MKLTIKRKLFILGLGLVAVQGAVSIGLTIGEGRATNTQAKAILDELNGAKLFDHVAAVMDSVETLHTTQVQHLAIAGNVTGEFIAHAGGVVVHSDTVSWQATNQETHVTKTVALPRWTLGGEGFAPGGTRSGREPLVDRVASATHAKCAVLQRMNDAGDMLRIATTLTNAEGRRATGTYIPAVGSDGTPNPVIAHLLAGESYTGRSSVRGERFESRFEPIRGADGAVIGAFAVAVHLGHSQALKDAIAEQAVGESGYIFVLRGSGPRRGEYVVSKDHKRDGEKLWDIEDPDGNRPTQLIVETALALEPGEQALVKYPWLNPGDAEPRTKLAKVAYYEPFDWVVGVSANEDEFLRGHMALDDGLDEIVATAAIFGLISILLLGGVFYWVSSSLAKRLKRFVKVFRGVAEGDLRQRIEDASSDEIGQLAGTVGEMISGLTSLISEMRKASSTVSGGANEIATGSEDLAQRTQEQASSLEQTSASVAEMVESVRCNADNAKIAEAEASKTRDLAGEGATIMSDAVSAMEEVSASAKEITEIVTLVNDIAFQTNLLALNAAVEAARAGAAGRGFAVVAGEVRRLSGRTAEAAEQVRRLIEQSNEAVSRTNETVRLSGETLDRILQAARNTSDVVEAITQATEEQASALDQVAKAVGQMDEVTQQNAALVEQASASAMGMAGEAQLLDELAHSFSINEDAAAAARRERLPVPFTPANDDAFGDSKLGAGSSTGSDDLFADAAGFDSRAAG